MAGVSAPPVDPTHLDGPWYKLLTKYHWFVFAVAALGWLFDTMDQQLFVLARDEAVADLLKISPTDPQLAKFGGNATMVFLFGWAAGGLGFGIMGDRVGRVKTMLATILLYSIFTGLSVFATGYYDFMAYRFLTGLGVGGEFAVGVALVAEVMPDRARPYALSWLQALSAVGNCTAALIYIVLGHLQSSGALDGLTLPGGTPFTAWRIAFSIGTLPALLAIFVRRKLKEPERWQAADAKHQKRGSYAELFGNPILRRNAFIGLAIGFAGVVGLWGIGFFSVQLQKSVFRELFTQEGMTGIELEGAIKKWSGYTSLMLNVGAFFGMILSGLVAQRLGRRKAFAIAFTLGMLSTASVFAFFDSRTHVFTLIPLMGVCLLSIFGCLAIYFPELFPTRLRSTGTSFCYNVGRFVAAVGPFMFGFLTSSVFAGYKEIHPSMPMRYAGVSMCAIFLLGLAVLPFAPETKGKPLPE
ncbi:MAG: MFS transporter [Planctomycetales bacterium]|nr:MFS transporter [Planctomycetales bacterium]MBN8624449.1 MFS transporter [Planctomycetota bacterium]